MSPIEFVITGKIVPKARPRLTRHGHSYMPKEYLDSRHNIEKQLLAQLHIAVPLQQCRIALSFAGAYPKSDPDNIIGTILDAMVAVGIIKNDTVKQVPFLAVDYLGGTEHYAILSVYPTTTKQ